MHVEKTGIRRVLVITILAPKRRVAGTSSLEQVRDPPWSSGYYMYGYLLSVGSQVRAVWNMPGIRRGLAVTTCMATS